MTLAHELGHTLNFKHSTKTAASGVAVLEWYGGNSTRLMGASRVVAGDEGGGRMCFNAEKHYELGWSLDCDSLLATSSLSFVIAAGTRLSSFFSVSFQ